jgi:hypothetical protein
LPNGKRGVYKPLMKRLVILAATLAACSSSAHAEIKVADQNGFNVVQKATVNATPEVIWKRLLSPKDWWNEAHSWSGTSAGFTLDAQANGCFCELFQEKQKDGKLKTVGSVEHMRVIFALPGKVLRMQGALGPLQAEAVTGTLTVAIEPVKDDEGNSASNSILSFSYVVGGYMRYKVSDIAPAMDKVIGEQFAGLIKPFVKTEAAAASASEWTLDLDDVSQAAPATSGNDNPADSAKKPAPKSKFVKEGKIEPR